MKASFSRRLYQHTYVMYSKVFVYTNWSHAQQKFYSQKIVFPPIRPKHPIIILPLCRHPRSSTLYKRGSYYWDKNEGKSRRKKGVKKRQENLFLPLQDFSCEFHVSVWRFSFFIHWSCWSSGGDCGGGSGSESIMDRASISQKGHEKNTNLVVGEVPCAVVYIRVQVWWWWW